LFLALWLVVCGYAVARGGAPERLTAGALMSAMIGTIISSYLLHPTSADAYSSMEFWVALTDLILLIALVAIALVSTRYWPMVMASMHGCGVLGHIAKPLAPDILSKAYYATVALWAYPMVILLAIATWRHRGRLRRYGVDYAWVWQLPNRYRNGWSVDELARPLPHN
jgi:hypothetical protein